MPRSAEPILDASALICLIRRERGWEDVAKFGSNCRISAVNVVEVIYSLRKHKMPLEEINSCIELSIGEVVPFDWQQSVAAAAIHMKTRDAGIALADCACLALGMTSRAVVVTADRKWTEQGLDVEVVQIR
jgi:PIN domain nuclease of toxin-antitoxin system